MSRRHGNRSAAGVTRPSCGLLVLGLALVVALWGQPAAQAAVQTINVTATVETTPVPNSGDAADDPAIWIHPTDPSLSTIIGTDKTAGGGLAVYDLSGRQLYFYAHGRLNNVDVRYNFPLGGSSVSIVGATNRELKRIDFYTVNPTTRALTRAGSVPTSQAIGTPRGFSFYVSPVTGKYYAFVTDVGKTDQYELSGASGSVTGTLVRQFTLPNPTEGLVADDELGRLYVAEENVGGIWRYGAEPGDGTTGVKVDGTTETGGTITQDVKGLTLYYGADGAGYLIAASQGGSSFHIYNRGDNVKVGVFKVVAGTVDGVTGEDGIDVTNFGLGSAFPAGFFISQDHVNEGGGNQNFKVVPWQSIANGFSTPLLVDKTFDPRLIGGSGGGGGGGGGDVTPPDTSITAGPTGTVRATTASFSFSATEAGSTFECSLDAGTYASCASPKEYTGLGEGSHTFRVRATDTAGNTDQSPATRTWTVDLTAPTVTSTIPASGASGVSVGTTVAATFSESMSPGSLTTDSFRLLQGGATPVAAGVTYDEASRTATLSPTSALTPDTTYTATVTTAASDVAGNGLAAARSWSFTTGSAGQPGTISRQSVSTTVNPTASNAITVAKPAGTAPGDVLVACLSLTGGQVASTGVPAGWVRFAAATTVSVPHVFGYYHVVGNSDPASYQWSLSSSVTGGAGIARYSGVNTTNPLDATPTAAAGASSTTGTVPGVTTASASAMLVGCMGVNSSSTTLGITSPSGMSQAWDIGGRRSEFADGVQATAGGSGSKAWQFTSAREWAGWLTALRPA
jgi:myo-inositol-hexaphosphate 3-phosphohydrolase